MGEYGGLHGIKKLGIFSLFFLLCYLISPAFLLLSIFHFSFILPLFVAGNATYKSLCLSVGRLVTLLILVCKRPILPLLNSLLPLPYLLLPLPNRPRQRLPCIRPCSFLLFFPFSFFFHPFSLCFNHSSRLFSFGL